MSGGAWYSQLFENSFGGGVLLALPYEGLASWDGTGDDYQEVIAEEETFLLRPVGRTLGLFVGDDEGVQEAHWMRLAGQPGIILVVWSQWHDPHRATLPEKWKEVARAWNRGRDPRQPWLEQQIPQANLRWTRQEPQMAIAGGVLLLMHGEGQAWKARLARPRSVARCGQFVPVGIAPGSYQVETTMIDELPEGRHLCFAARWIPAAP